MGNYVTVESLAAQLDTSASRIETSGQNIQKLQKQGQEVQQALRGHQMAVRQLRQRAAMLESRIEQLREMLASIDDADDDSGSAEQLRSQIQAQIAQMQSQKYAVESRTRQEEQQARQAEQQLQSLLQQVQGEKSQLVQMRSALAQADQEYAGLASRHGEAQRLFQRIGQYQNKGTSIGAGRSMEQVVQASRQGQSRVAQLQQRIEHYLGDGVIPGTVAAVAGLGIAGAAAHRRASTTGTTGMRQNGSLQSGPGVIPTAEPSAQAVEEMNTPTGFLRNMRRGRDPTGITSEPEGLSPEKQQKQSFRDQLIVKDSDMQPAQPAPRPQGNGPGTGQRIRERGGYGRDDDDGPSRHPGASNRGTSSQGAVSWVPPMPPPQKPSVIPSNWKRIEGPHSLLDDIATVNPDYQKGHLSTRVNCQRCVVAGEMRRRGYDVVAQPAVGQTMYRLNAQGEPEAYWASAEQGGLPYLFAPDGSVNPNGFAAAFKDAKPVSCTVDSGMMSARIVNRQMKEWGEGARAIVAVYWAGVARDADQNLYTVDVQDGKWVYRNYKTDALLTDPEKIKNLEHLTEPSSGHVFKAEVINGKVVCYDEQSGSHDMATIQRYFRMARGRKTQLIRIDDLEPTELVQKCCKPR